MNDIKNASTKYISEEWLKVSWKDNSINFGDIQWVMVGIWVEHIENMVKLWWFWKSVH